MDTFDTNDAHASNGPGTSAVDPDAAVPVDRPEHDLMVSGARAFVDWAQALPESVHFPNLESALAAFSSHLASKTAPIPVSGTPVLVPPGWKAVPIIPDESMLQAFQSGFKQELRRRGPRKVTAEQAGLIAMLKRTPALPFGWFHST